MPSIVERMLEESIGEIGITGSYFINTNDQSPLELLQHQNNI